MAPTAPPATRSERIALVLAIASDNGGLISTRAAAAHGLPSRLLDDLARNAVLVRLHNGLYRVPTSLDSADDLTLLGRAIARASGAALSHLTAAREYGCPVPALSQVAPGDQVVHLVLDNARTRLSVPTGIRVHYSRAAGGFEIGHLGGVPITTAPRTLVDLCTAPCKLSDAQVTACVDHLVASRRTTVAHLMRYLGTSPRRPGKTRLTALLGDPLTPRVESALERAMLELLGDAGLPRPATQHPVFDEQGAFVARLDIAWPGHRVALEVDSFRHHSGWTAAERDRRRRNRLIALGWSIFEATAGDITEAHRSENLQAQLAAVLRHPGESPAAGVLSECRSPGRPRQGDRRQARTAAPSSRSTTARSPRSRPDR
jgi:hypothetical protein